MSQGRAMKTLKAMKQAKTAKAMKRAKPMKQVKAMKSKAKTIRKTVQKNRNPNGEFGKSPSKFKAVSGKPMPAFAMWDGVFVRPYDLKLPKMKPLDLVCVGPPKTGGWMVVANFN